MLYENDCVGTSQVKPQSSHVRRQQEYIDWRVVIESKPRWRKYFKNESIQPFIRLIVKQTCARWNVLIQQVSYRPDEDTSH